MVKYTKYLAQILPLMRNTWLPAFLLCAVLGVFFVLSPFSVEMLHFFHIGFFIANLVSIGFLIRYNQNRPLFFIVVLLLVYCLINYMKYVHGVIYYLTPDYLNLSFLAALGLLYFYFLPNRPLFSNDTLNFLLVVFAGVSLGEYLSEYQIAVNLTFFLCTGCGLQNFALAVYGAVLVIMMVYASIKDDILNSALFFAAISIVMGFYFSNDVFLFSMFFFNAAVTCCYGVIYSIYYSRNKDVITGLDNGNAFINDVKKFPIKYGLGIICIDDYKHLAQAFKKNGINELTIMISHKVKEIEPETMLYRCSFDEFVIVFPQAEKGTSFERLDNIRRQIAAAEFVLNNRKKPLKVTVSCSIAEKKRSDADVFEVFVRARRTLQKTYKFTQNITSQA